MGSREAFGLRSASCHCSCDACASHASQNCCIEGRLRKHVAHNDSDDSKQPGAQLMAHWYTTVNDVGRCRQARAGAPDVRDGRPLHQPPTAS